MVWKNTKLVKSTPWSLLERMTPVRHNQPQNLVLGYVWHHNKQNNDLHYPKVVNLWWDLWGKVKRRYFKNLPLKSKFSHALPTISNIKYHLLQATKRNCGNIQPVRSYNEFSMCAGNGNRARLFCAQGFLRHWDLDVGGVREERNSIEELLVLEEVD